MNTHVIEIIPDSLPQNPKEDGWADWAVDNVKEHGWKAAVGGLVVAPLLPAAVGAVAVSAGVISGVQHGVAWLRGSDTAQKIEVSKSSHLRDEHNLPVQEDRFYIVHPNSSKANVAILASDFHEVIIGEQIADLVTFIRGTVRAGSIKIEVESERKGSAGGNFFSRFSFKADGGVAKHHSVDLSYDNPQIVDMQAMPFWLCLFPEVVTAFKDAQRGSIKRRVSIDTSFGVSSSLADQAGIDTNWLGRKSFVIEASFS